MADRTESAMPEVHVDIELGNLSSTGDPNQDVPTIEALNAGERKLAAEDRRTATDAIQNASQIGTLASVKSASLNLEEDETNYLHGPKLALLVISLMSGLFTIALDNAIISTAIPRITSDFQSLDDVGWYGSAYLLTLMSLQPSFGKIFTFFNMRTVYIAALLIFELGSIICAVAPNSMTLIIGRAIAGVGASGMFSGMLAIMRYTVTMRKRPLVMSITGSVFAVSSVLGPLLGGLLTDSRLTWRFCFWLNLPFGALAIAIVVWTFKPPVVGGNLTFRRKLEHLDILGALFLISAIVCLVLALQWGGTVYSWSYSKVWGCLLGFGTITIVFILSQALNKDKAMIQFRIVSQRTVIFSCLYITFLQMGMTTQSYYVPFYFQAVKGTSAAASGLRTLPYGITIAIASLISGSLISRFGYYVPFVWTGAIIFTVGSALLHTLTPTSQFSQWFAFEVLSGAGYGLSQQVGFMAVQTVLSLQDAPMGLSLINFCQSLGGSLGLSIGQNIFSNSLTERLLRIPGLNVAAVVRQGATKIQDVVPATLLESVLEAYNFALTRVFILVAVSAGMATLCSLGLEWRKIDKKH